MREFKRLMSGAYLFEGNARDFLELGFPPITLRPACKFFMRDISVTSGWDVDYVSVKFKILCAFRRSPFPPLQAGEEAAIFLRSHKTDVAGCVIPGDTEGTIKVLVTGKEE